MKPLVCGSVALALASLPAAAIAQVTQTYKYDANGRLTGVTTTGSGGTKTAAYAYDDSDNRTSLSQTGTGGYAALSRLPAGDDLLSHQALVSPNGRFSLAVRDTGIVELWADRSIVGSSLVDEQARPIFALDGEGNARFRGTGSENGRLSGAYLALEDDGDLALFDGVGFTLLWRGSSDAEAAQ